MGFTLTYFPPTHTPYVIHACLPIWFEGMNYNTTIRFSLTLVIFSFLSFLVRLVYTNTNTDTWTGAYVDPFPSTFILTLILIRNRVALPPSPHLIVDLFVLELYDHVRPLIRHFSCYCFTLFIRSLVLSFTVTYFLFCSLRSFLCFCVLLVWVGV